MFDFSVSMDSQISSVCSSIHWHLRKNGSIRSLLSTDATEKLVHSLISSRLDYCNILLNGLPANKIQRLQCAQNCAARIVSRVKKQDHITPVLKDLHWLPVTHRITFKLILLTYKALNGKAPAYLKDLLKPYSPGRVLRSADKLLLCVPSSRLKGFGDRTFAFAAPSAWNLLPIDIRMSPSLDMFKTMLKTHLFSQAYDKQFVFLFYFHPFLF